MSTNAFANLSNLKSKLREKIRREEDIEKKNDEDDVLFHDYYQRLVIGVPSSSKSKNVVGGDHRSFKIIPKFYEGIPTATTHPSRKATTTEKDDDDDSSSSLSSAVAAAAAATPAAKSSCSSTGGTPFLSLKLREEARAQFLQKQSGELLDNQGLKSLWNTLDKYSSSSSSSTSSSSDSKDDENDETEQMLTYVDYLKVKEECKVESPKCTPFFTAQLFAKLGENDPYGRISVMGLFNYVMRKVWLHQTRIGLSLYDVTGEGYLRETDLENYISELIDTLPQLEGLERSFHSFYICTAVRKFFFFLDPLRSGKVKIRDILACSFLDELLELRDQELSKEVQECNWFSAPSALRVYGQYLNLDTDHNGMLSQIELKKYGTGTLTEAFIERIFQEYLTYEGEMDYKTYLDFVLAMENKSEPQSVQYFFRLLDVRHDGWINTFSLNYFFRDILKEMKALNQEPVKFEDVKDEIYDMVRPKDPLKITRQDLIASGHANTVISILSDLNGFWTYENREVVITED